MNILREKQRLLPLGGYMMGGGGSGGGGGPSSTTVQNTNVPEYARPYVESMLGATQNELFNTQKVNPTYDAFGNRTSAGGTEITGVKPFQAFGQEGAGLGAGEMAAARSAFAGFDPLQDTAYQGTQNLRVPGQYGQASDITGAGIMGSFGTANQAGNVGNQYNQMATNPNAVQAFMNPYVQAALNPQIELMQRQQGQQAAQMAGQATQAGAFGGSRFGLAQANQNLNNQLAQQNLVGQGYNNAFNQAQQAQQFGANLGLQGLQAKLQGYGQGLQGANQLANIGGQELQARQGILNAQNQMGAQRQAYDQNVINQAMQNYGNQQQNYQQKLSFMNAMLRGLPMQSATTQSYQAAPSALSQVAGLGTAAAGAYRLSGMKKGGKVAAKDNTAAGLADLALMKMA